MFTGLFSKPNVDIVIEDNPNRKRFKVIDHNETKLKLPTFRDKDTVTGKVILNLNSIKSFEHKGIKLQLIGQLESPTNKNDSFIFITLTNELEAQGSLSTSVTTWPFKFSDVELKYETYRGVLRNVKYFLRLTVEVTLKTLSWEQEFAVLNPEPLDVIDIGDQFKLEIGVEDWLLLYFQIDKMSFSLKDIIKGTVLFKTVGIKLNTMELHIIKREMVLSDSVNTTGTNSNLKDNSSVLNNTTMAKYQIMDGGPTKNETVIIRLPLKTYLLTPSYPNIANKFSVQYYMSIVLYDIEERKYTKQHEIFLHRIDKKLKASIESDNKH